MAQPQMVWKVSKFENNYANEKYATDRENINKALEAFGRFDIAATRAEEDAINAKLTQPQTPDDLSKTVAARAQALCNAGDEAPIKFRGIFKFRDPSPNEGETRLYIRTPAYSGHDAEYADWTWTGISWPSRINALNRLPLASRAAAQFRFDVIFGNSLQGLNWSVERWMEVAIHEVGIHVIQGLRGIEMWRQGKDWPEVDAEGNLDHLLFRFAGYRRYSLWRNRMTPDQIAAIWPAVKEWDLKEQDRDQNGRDLVQAFYKDAPGDQTNYDFMKCCQLATHFPAQQNQLVKDTSSPPLVDKRQSQAFVGVLKGQLDQIFQYQNGNLTELKASFHWW